MKEIRNIRIASDARITILRDRIRFSARACQILGIKPTEPFVKFHEHHGKMFVSNAKSPSGFRTATLQRRAVINSTELAGILSTKLKGYNTYRLMEEDYTFENGNVCYRISAEPYDNRKGRG